MSKISMPGTFPLPAALAGAAFLATCIVIGAGSALATPEPVATIEPAAVVTPAVASSTDACTRKVRVVYGGYAAAPGCGTTR